jgi:hypothetical protein
MKQIFRRLCFFVVLFFLCSSHLSAQSKFSLTEGWGYYELSNIGVRWNFSDISSLWLYGGTNFGFNDKTLWSAGLTFDQTAPKPLFWKLRPGYSLGVLYWSSDDDLYYFKTMSFPAMVHLLYPISMKYSLRVDGGGLFNAVLQSDRKQNVEAGYPSRINGNVRVTFIFNPGAK